MPVLLLQPVQHDRHREGGLLLDRHGDQKTPAIRRGRIVSPIEWQAHVCVEQHFGIPAWNVPPAAPTSTAISLPLAKKNSSLPSPRHRPPTPPSTDLPFARG